MKKKKFIIPKRDSSYGKGLAAIFIVLFGNTEMNKYLAFLSYFTKYETMHDFHVNIYIYKKSYKLFCALNPVKFHVRVIQV